MVYYIKAMANGLTKKVALPIAFAAMAMTPAMAESVDYKTTLKLVGPEKMAIGQDQDVYLVMDNQVEDLSIVEFKLLMPEHGLWFVENTFELVGKNLPTGFIYKIVPESYGYKVGIYNPHQLKKIGTTKEGGDTIAKFKIHATNYLTEQPVGIGLEIIDLSRSNSEQFRYRNVGTNDEEGTEGDNSLGLAPITEDKDILPGDWDVTVPGTTNVNTADPALQNDSILTLKDSTITLVPNDTVYRKQHFDVNLKNIGNKIGGLSFNLMLPKGMSLDESSVKPNAARTDKAAHIERIAGTNSYVIAVMGSTLAIAEEDGSIVSFDVSVDRDNTAKALDTLKLTDVTVTSIFNTELKKDDIVLKVRNLNQEAYDSVMAVYKKKITYFIANNDIIERVWDYPEVLEARNAYTKFLKEKYAEGVMHFDGVTDEAKNLIKDIRTALEKNWVNNKNLYNEYVKVGIPALTDSLENTIPEGVVYPKIESAFDYIPAKVAEDYEAAKAAIKALAEKVDELWNEKKHAETVKLENASAEKYDGALLIDSAEVSALKKAAQKAIDDFAETLKKVNTETAEELGKLVDDGDEATRDDLQDLLEDAQKVVDEMSPATKDLTKVFSNFPEVLDAVSEAQDAINAVNDSIEKYKDLGWLPFSEGINPVLDAVEKAKDAIENVKTVAQKLKDENYVAYSKGMDEYKGLEVSKNSLGNGVPADVKETETYKDIVKAVEDALKDYKDLLEHDDSLGMCDKDSVDLKEALQNAKDELAKAVDAIGNLKDLNVKIDKVKDAYDKVEQKLQDAIDPDNNKYLEDGVITKDDIEKINNALDNIKHELDSIAEEINEKEPWTKLNVQDNIDRWNVELENLLKELLGDDGDLDDKGGIEGDIADAVEKYKNTHKRGDANMDGNVSMLDYNIIQDYVRGDLAVQSDEYFDQANVIQEPEFGDYKEINVTDALGALKIYSNGGTDEGLKLARQMTAVNESLTMSEQNVDGVRRIALNLNNELNYAAAQFDVVLPEGMSIVGAQLGSRNKNHSLYVGKPVDGKQRVVIISTKLNLIEGNSGAVVYLDVEGIGDVKFDHVIFATENCQSKMFTVSEAETTGVAGVKAAAEQGEQVYSIGGRLMNALKKGINIIRRADGTTQKVIK
jgi:hypothetical protein